MLLRTRQFSGERPKLSERLIGVNEATLALDCDLVSGELRAVHGNRAVASADDPNAQTLFILGGVYFTWPGDVSVVETPVNAAVRRLFWTGDGPPSQSEPDELAEGKSYLMGVPKPAAKPVVASITGPEPDSQTRISSLYRFTFVNRWGEEGDASPPSDLFDYYSGQTMRVTGLGAGFNVGLENRAVVAYRLYRLSGAESKFVGEYPLSQGTVVDSKKESELGEIYSAENYYIPPLDMQNLHIMANGVALGSVGSQIYASEPYDLNAWPYTITLQSPVVAISSFDNNAVFLTEGFPEIATIFDPRNISTTVLAEREPCLSRRGVVQGAGGVIYPSPSGLFYIGSGAARMLTEEYMDINDWQALAPTTFNAAYRDGQYITFFDAPGNRGGWIFDLREPTAMVRRLSQWVSASFVAEGTDEMYLVNGATIELYQGGQELLDYCWRGKLHGDGSPFALSSRRFISPDFADNPTAEEVEAIEVSNQALIDRNIESIALMLSASAVAYCGVEPVEPVGVAALLDEPNFTGATNDGYVLSADKLTLTSGSSASYLNAFLEPALFATGSGLYYWETLVNLPTGAGNSGTGIAVVADQPMWIGANDTSVALWYRTFWTNGAPDGRPLLDLDAGDVIQHYLDLDNESYTVRYNDQAISNPVFTLDSSKLWSPAITVSASYSFTQRFAEAYFSYLKPPNALTFNVAPSQQELDDYVVAKALYDQCIADGGTPGESP